jgi:uncharacterized membrane protein
MMKLALTGYLTALVVILVLDGIWLGLIAREFYQNELGSLAAAEIRKVPAALFYIAYPAGIVALALYPVPESLTTALLRSAIVGLVAYGTYDLTNMATLRDWSVKLSVVDTLWGVFASSIAGIAAYLMMKRLPIQ